MCHSLSGDSPRSVAELRAGAKVGEASQNLGSLNCLVFAHRDFTIMHEMLEGVKQHAYFTHLGSYSQVEHATANPSVSVSESVTLALGSASGEEGKRDQR